MSDAPQAAVHYPWYRSVSTGYGVKGEREKMWLTSEWAKVVVAALTLLGLAIHAIAS
jgi:hypothetical protein